LRKRGGGGSFPWNIVSRKSCLTNLPGPELGRGMERLREAESLGTLAAEADALAFIRKIS